MSGLDVGFDNARRITGNQTSGGNISRNDATRRDDAAIADSDSGQNNRVSADKAVISYVNIEVAIVHPIMSEDRRPESHDRILSDVDAAWVRLINLGAERNNTSLPNLHMPQTDEVLAPKFLYEFTQFVANPCRYRSTHLPTPRIDDRLDERTKNF